MDILSLVKTKKEEEILFERWIHSFSSMSFDEYKKQIGYRPQGQEVKEKTAEEIVQEVMEVMRKK